MVGGLIQLMHIGNKGNNFIGNPEISFFKKVYKSYMNFAMNFEEININSIDLNNFDEFFNKRGFCELPILGDLINKSYIKLEVDFQVNNFNLNIILNEHIIKTNGTSNEIQLINNNNLLFVGDTVYFNTDIYNLYTVKIINKNEKYTIDTIEGDKIKLIGITDIFQIINTQVIKIYNIYFSSDNKGVEYEDIYNQSKPEIYLYNYKYNIINNFDLTINFYEIDDFIASEINQNNKSIDLINIDKKIFYNISSETLSYSFTGKLYIKIIKEDITKIIKEVSFEIDEYIIEKHNTSWLLTYDKLFNNNETTNIINNNIKYITSNLFNTNCILYIPLRFTFTNNIYNSLPIVALYNSYNYIRLQTNKIEDCFITSKILNKEKISIKKFSLLLNYIYLDPKHKNYFLNDKQELLIQQIQNQYEKIYNNQINNINLNFSYLCKILIWTLPYKYLLKNAQIVFNLETIIDDYEGEYYHLIQPLECNLGNSESFTKMEYNNDTNGTYYMYSFALYPNKVQPSGLCNMSRIDDKKLKLELNYIHKEKHLNKILYSNVFTINYNYLIIFNGKGKLQYF
jgi:hypothetical protein